MRVANFEEMKAIEKVSAEKYGLSEHLIIENVGIRAADYLWQHFLCEKSYAEVVILVGKGNNGADGMSIGRHLTLKGVPVRALMLFSPQDCSQELKKQIQMGEAYGIKISEMGGSDQVLSYFTQTQSEYFVIDAIFGTGVRLPVPNSIFEVIKVVNEHASVMVAVDIPTGVDGDTGALDGSAIKADLTLAIGLPKLGHYAGEGARASGKVVVLDAGFPLNELGGGNTSLLTPTQVAKVFLYRNQFAGKNLYGHTLVLGGSPGLSGALILSATAALKVGAGLVTAMTWKESYPELVSRVIPEIMTRSLPESKEEASGGERLWIKDLEKYDTVVVGPGFSRSPHAREVVLEVLGRFPGPVVLDADAINVLKAQEDQHFFSGRKFPVIMTPHLGEFSRFTNIPMKEVEQYPFKHLKQLIENINCSILLKGAASYLGLPNGKIFINYFPNDGMATGGSGDVLAGILGGLFTQIFSAKEIKTGIFFDAEEFFDSACLGLMVHSMAGKHAAKKLGVRPMTAGSIIDFLPEAFFEIDDMIKKEKI